MCNHFSSKGKAACKISDGTLINNDQQKISKHLKSDFKRRLETNHNIMTMNSIFKKVNRFFVLAFENNNNDRIESSFV